MRLQPDLPPKSPARDPLDLATAEKVLAGGGEMGAFMRGFDWSATPLGPVSTWPQSLRTTVSICLNSRFPILIWWGPELVMLYNDGYRPILGAKHPQAMGQPGLECWAEITDIIGPMLRGVLERGEATWSENQMLPLARYGYVEECYFTFSYSPVYDGSGLVAGVFTAVTEVTEQVLGARRLGTLRLLAERSAAGQTPEEACARAAKTLGDASADLPFSLVYLLAEDGKTLHLAGASGLPPGTDAAPERIDLAADDSPWKAAQVLREGRPEVVTGLAGRVGQPRGFPWPEPVQTALVLPIASSGQTHGVLVAGVSPRLELKDNYRAFYELVSGQVANSIASAKAFEQERQRAEALAQLDSAKTAFFSNVSHEFRTPLTLMLGPTEDLLSGAHGALAPAQREQALVVHRNALRLLKLVNTLLDFSRIEAGRMQAAYEPTELARVTAELASVFRSAIERAGLTLKVDCPALPEPVYVDPELWEKIVLNLLSNALKFTFEGGIEVSLRAAGERVELVVRDTGTGIPERELPRIFERFYRVEGARSRTHEGSGIGLALVQELVKMHGGTLGVASRAGEGSTFTVSLPRGSAHLPRERIGAERTLASTTIGAAPFLEGALRWLPDAAPPSAEAPPAPAPAASSEARPSLGPSPDGARTSARARILVVDDNADMREYIARLLSKEWTVESAPNGRVALEAARRNPPKLVLADVMMPELDGLGLLRALREDPRTRSVPVIFLSARAGEESLVEGMAAGADDYLVKPFSARELLARVRTRLELVRLRAEAAEERERFRAAFAEASVGMALSDLHRRFLGTNRAFAELTGYPEEELRGMDFARLTHPDDRERNLALLQKLLDGEVPGFVIEKRYLRKDGSAVWVQNSVSLIRNEAGAPASLIAITEDISARKRVETERAQALERERAARADAEAANRAKDEFLAMLGHELRNPLAPILTALQLMRLRGGDTSLRERTIIERQVKHVVRLVDDLLDVSRITRGKIELKKAPVEMAELVAKAIEVASPLLEQKQHTLNVDVPSRGLLVNADSTRLTQVISNLLTNAAKYTDPRGEIHVTAERAGSQVLLRVRDNGVGISPEMLPKVFDLFVQERQALDRSQGGLGLGLTIVRSLLELHGGGATAHSEGLGRGTEIVVRLPLSEPRDATPPPSRGRSNEPRTPAPCTGGRRILVVDDNKDAATMLAESLEVLGYVTRVAFDGPSALRLAEDFGPEVALLDIGLPVMDGYELASRLRARSGVRSVRLVAITGYGQDVDRARTQSSGFDLHLVKPVNLNAITAFLNELDREPRR